MKLPVSMLRDFVQTDLSTEQIGDLLTMAGFELEGLQGEVLDLKVMANRGDGLSALGLAREILAKDSASRPTELYASASSRFSATATDSAEASNHARVVIQSDKCSRYAAKIFLDVQNGNAPAWIAERLAAAGMRSISLLVDLTNYIMLELGQPLHAFDLDKLEGHQIVVREAHEGETITTLDGVTHKLQTHHLCICDASRPVAVAGVMGGEETEVSSTTRNVLLESAHFSNTSVRRTRKDLNFATESSYRFERSVDPDGVVAALRRFEELYQEATGASAIPGVIDAYPGKRESTSVQIRMSRTHKLLGIEVQATDAKRYLESLGMGVSGSGEPFTVEVPSWRFDLIREDDLIEEIARVHGYDRIPELPLRGENVRGRVSGLPELADQARCSLLRSGFTQVMNHTLRDRHPLDFTENWRIGPRNPHSPETALMRDSLLPGLAETALRNGARNLHLFEIGRVFVKGDHQVDESIEIGLLSTGALSTVHWSGNKANDADFFSLKGAVEELAGALKDSIVFDRPWDPDRRFHPTRQAGVLLDHGRSWAGTVGQIHPDIADSIGLPRETFLAELDLFVFAIHDDAELPLRQISKNPAVRRDIAFVIPKSVAWSQIEAVMVEAGGSELEKMWLFDRYEGKGIEDDHHSLAVALQLRRMGANLTDEDANTIRDRVVASVAGLGGKLR
ncbi:MAG: phenylalanine--tRNA ligase subunit beta [Armatimonadetes bacterium]|nr:phenylalanine--tRNA ligase subunit beta [Armatimonadota bacterium]